MQEPSDKTPQPSMQDLIQKSPPLPQSSRQEPIPESPSGTPQPLPQEPMDIVQTSVAPQDIRSDMQSSSPQKPVRSPLSPILSSTLQSNANLSPAMAVDLPSTSFAVLTPGQIQPMPKIAGRRNNVRRVKVDTSVLTSTPYKNYLEEETKKKTAIEQKKATKKENKILKPVVNKKKNKGKGSGKGKKNQRSYKSDSSDEDNDTECLFCTETYSKDNRGEGWIRCVVCLKWGHEACAGIDSDDGEEFTYDLCLSDRFASTKKKLTL